jgi:uncharacterized membrane protein AbrB (regulator of aidB expression)
MKIYLEDRKLISKIMDEIQLKKTKIQAAWTLMIFCVSGALIELIFSYLDLR